LLAWFFSAAGPAATAPPVPGDLELDDELVAQFEQHLAKHHIQLHFFSGAWESLSLGSRADILLTSETIYALDSVPSLCRVLRESCWPTTKPDSAGNVRESTLCLVAAKVLYFGVGGSVDAFGSMIAAHGGWCHEVRTFSSGVGRVVLQVGWPAL